MSEIEVKYQLPFIPKIKKLMEGNGFIFVKKTFERNFIFDTVNYDLKANNKLLRLRLYTSDLVLIRGILTTKSRIENTKFKEQNEIETYVDKPQAVLSVLKNAFDNHLEYQKFRSSYKSKELKVTACIDELPFGTFLELEAFEEEHLTKAIKLLKLEKQAKCLVGYPKLCNGKNQAYDYKFVKKAFSAKNPNKEFEWN
jgi:adenylate cyclase, class 2